MNRLNNFSRALLAIVMILFVGIPSFAQIFKVDGLNYKITDNNAKTVRVISDDYDRYSGVINIPSNVTYNNEIYSVTEIGQAAFYGSRLTEISIPSSITKIGIHAFVESAVEAVRITDLAAWCKIDFHDRYSNPLYAENYYYLGSSFVCKLILNDIEITTLDIPNEITEIKQFAFSNAKITEVNIPNSVTKIDTEAFNNCRKLTKVNIAGNSLKYIGESAFYYCDSLTTINLPNSVSHIGEYAFYRTNLTEFSIPNSLTEISDYMLYGCDFKTITIPNSITKIGRGAFASTRLTEIVIPNTVTTIEPQAFSWCSDLNEATLPNSLTEISDSLFCKCSDLRSVFIPNSITKIGQYAFYECEKLKLTIPNSVTLIGNQGIHLVGVVVSLSTTPPTCIPYSYVNYSTLYVPKDSYAIYSKTNTWKDFKNIYEFDTLASSIELNKSEETIDAFSWSFLSATISPSDASIKECSWFSDNPRVASVDNTGKITGISPGTATITAKTIDGTNISDSCKVTINSVTPYITLSKSTATLAIDQKMALYYTIGNSYTQKATWSTNSRYVAYVTGTWDNGATIAGVADGEAIITATMVDNGVEYSASCKVIVGVGGIEVVEVDDNAVEVSRYDIHGRLLTEPTKGINIIKMSDGSTKKELIK